jgi:hypothetical protein
MYLQFEGNESTSVTQFYSNLSRSKWPFHLQVGSLFCEHAEAFLLHSFGAVSTFVSFGLLPL